MAGPSPSPAAAWAALTPRPVTVVERVQETADTWTLTLDPGDPFAFAAGQFNMLYAFGAGEAPISISGDPADPTRLVHTIRVVGPVTRALCALEPGEVLGLRGPFGSAWPVDAARGGDALVVAGGLGLAPLRPVLYRLLAEREAFGRVALFYGTRTPADLLFRDELLSWRSRFDMQVYVTVDTDTADTPWRGDVGVVTALIPRARFDPAATTAFVCGPEVMMRFGSMALAGEGVALERIHISAERSMKCAVGHCGHCQYGPDFVCKDGPVYPYDQVAARLRIREL
jgi:NAD(P)H-flavin reductase